MVEANTLAVFRYAKLMRLLVVGFFVVSAIFSIGTPTVFAVDPDSRAAENAAADPQPATVVCTDAETCSSATYQFLYNFVQSVVGTIVGIAGYTFDLFISYFIIKFGYLYQTSNLGYVINNVWGTVRDIFNLTFIFGLVYIGFQIILGTNEAEAKRTIPKLIIAALLVNFSLFFVKFIVDFANITAVQIYNLFESSGTGEASTVALVEGPSISRAFLNAMDISNALNVLPGGSELVYIFGMFLVFLVLIYVFFAGAIMIAVRFAVLCMYLVFSPIMFLGFVFPGMNHYTRDYWKGLIGQAFFAPAFLFMLYLSYKITDTFNNDTMRGGFSEVQKNTDPVATYVGIIPYFVMTIVFLIASMIIAKKMAHQGSEMSVTAFKKMNGYGQAMLGGTAFGAGAYIGERAIGGNAKRLTENASFRRFTSVVPGGMAVMNATKKVADTSFDVRQTAFGKTMDMGSGKKGGYTTRIKEKEKAKQQFYEDLGELDPTVYKKNQNAAAAVYNKAKEGLDTKSTAVHQEDLAANTEIESLTRKLNNPTKTEEEKAIISQQIAGINAKKAERATEVKKLEDAVKAAEADMRLAVTRDKYALQLLHMKSESYRKMAVGAAGAVALGTLGAATGTLPLALLAGAVGTAAVTPGERLMDKKMKKAFIKNWGANGEVRDGKKKHDEDVAHLAHVLTQHSHPPAAPASTPTGGGKPSPAADPHPH